MEAFGKSSQFDSWTVVMALVETGLAIIIVTDENIVAVGVDA